MPLLAFTNPKRRKAKRSRKAARASRSIVMRVNPAPAAAAPKRRKSRRTRRVSAKTRRSSRRSSGSAMTNPFKNVFTAQTGWTLGGVLLGNTASNFVLDKFGDKLPGIKDATGATNQTIRTAYATLVPIGVSMLVRRKNAALADGMVLGAIVNAANALIAKQAASTPTLAYALPPSLQVAGVRRFGRVAGNVKGLPVAFKAYPNGQGLPQPPNRVPTGNSNALYESASGFRNDPWAKA